MPQQFVQNALEFFFQVLGFLEDSVGLLTEAQYFRRVQLLDGADDDGVRR